MLAAAAVATLLAGTIGPASAQGLCTEAFAKWVRSSQATYLTQPRATTAPGEPAREACIPSEEARRALQRSLSVVRRQCDQPDAGSDAETAKPMLEINADVLARSPLCTDANKFTMPPTVVVTPAPGVTLPTRPATPAPAPAPPAAAAAVPTPTAASARDVDPNSCLAMGQTGKSYWIENTLCPGARVIVVLEIKLASGVRKCHGHVVTALTKLGTAKPFVNYECVENEGDCSTKSVKEIFPYCTW